MHAREVRQLAKDLVCGMEVDEQKAAAKVEYEGTPRPSFGGKPAKVLILPFFQRYLRPAQSFTHDVIPPDL